MTVELASQQGYPSVPLRRSRFGWVILALCALAAAAIWYKLESQRDSRLEVKQPGQPNLNLNSPQGKLELVISRLRSALAGAQTQIATGVVSRRRVNYRIVNAADDRSPLTAEVTILTSTSLHMGQTTQAVRRAQAALARKKAQEDSSQPADAMPADAKEVARAIVERRKTEQRQSYTLVYDSERWTMPEKPQGEKEQLLFKYALLE
jgi:hypothetical protein